MCYPLRCFCILVLILVLYTGEVVQWVQYFNFGSESSPSIAVWQWVYMANRAWVFECFDILWREVEGANDKSTFEAMIYNYMSYRVKIIRCYQWYC